MPAIVDNKKAIAIAVEGKADIGTLFNNTTLQIGAVFRLHWVETVVGQAAVRVEIDADQFDRQAIVDLL